jgi:hypothetical protein
MTRSRIAFLMLASVALGIVIGGNLFSRSQPRSIIALKSCDRCLRLADLAGLLVSIGVQRVPGLIPNVALETDKTVAIQLPGSGVHYVIFPKKDLKDLRDISQANVEYLLDAYVVARRLVEKNGWSAYRFYTNGPGRQNATYLHFHLVNP